MLYHNLTTENIRKTLQSRLVSVQKKKNSRELLFTTAVLSVSTLYNYLLLRSPTCFLRTFQKVDFVSVFVL